MFDFDRITQQITGLITGQTSEAVSVDGLLSSAGLDPQDLAGLGIDEALTALSEAGIDVSSLTDGQLAELLSGLGDSGAGETRG